MIRFTQINRTTSENYDPRYQRHHLIPLQVKSVDPLSGLIASLERIGFSIHDFQRNGILLPCQEQEAIRSAQPLHRGPHPRYNEMVIERMSMIANLGSEIADDQARTGFLAFRTSLLQMSLKRGLNGSGFPKFSLNHRDPLLSDQNFDNIDRNVDLLWSHTSRSCMPCDAL